MPKGKTDTALDVKSFVEGSGYSLLSEYVDNKTKIKVECCKGHQRDTFFQSFKKSKGCAPCTKGAPSQSEVKESFASEDYQLIGRYEASNKPLSVICNKGHASNTITWGNWKKGHKCAVCKGLRITHDDVKKAFEKRSYTLLSEYKGAHKKLDFICPNGHTHKMAWTHFQQGNECAKCVGGIRLTLGEVKTGFLSQGYTPLFESYTNAQTYLDYKCDKGHYNKIFWNAFQQGHRCPDCAGNKPLTTDYVLEEFAKIGYILLSEYKNSDKKLRFICANNHMHTTDWSNWLYGVRCGICAGRHKTTEYVSIDFEKRGYILLSEYKREYLPLKMICPNNHLHSIRWDSWVQGHGCGICGGRYVDTRIARESFEAESYKLESEFEHSQKPLNFTCPKGHKNSITWMVWNRGGRCQSCAEHGFNPNKPGILYYLRFDILHDSYYKIGITNRSIKERFAAEPLGFTVLKQSYYEKGNDARVEETKIKRLYKKYRYKGSSVLRSGNTELFVKDILELDYPKII
ncbi:MAG: hypothetical protein KME47_09385 [Nodosilinea sp. WJT8-NPBG4]|jgi:hypothetical protein|nr:hypothetical protein [Nodosilinea sp. WJT8-NPBG4]